MQETKTCARCGSPLSIRKVEKHVTSMYGIEISIVNSAELISCGCENSGNIRIPMPEKLIQAAALYRATIPTRLNGTELKFIRTVLEFPAKKFAELLDVDPATYSRWENDIQAMSASKERVARIYTAAALEEEAPAIEADVRDIIEMDISGWSEKDSFVEMTFVLSRFKRKEHYSDIDEVKVA